MSRITTEPMPLAKAQKRAEKIVTWLLPYCERVQVAGSIRRERPLCNDIDLVVIPKFAIRNVPTGDLLEPVKPTRINTLREFLCEYVTNDAKPRDGVRTGTAAWRGRDGQAAKEPPKEDASNLLLVTAAGVQLDVWCATPETWWTRLICRTGSMQHNIWAAERAQAMRGKWSPYESLRIFGEEVPLGCEAHFYEALKAPWIAPAQRESAFLNSLSREGAPV